MTGFKRSWTLRIAPMSWVRPSRARYSHWNGISTESAAVRAFTVSRPSDGGLSMKMKSYSSRTPLKRSRRRDSRESASTSSISAPESRCPAGTRSRFASAVGMIACRDVPLIDEHFVDAPGLLVAVDSEGARGVPLRIDIDDQDPSAFLGKARTQVDRSGRLPDAAFLAGYCDDASHSLSSEGADFLAHLMLRSIDRRRLGRTIATAPIGGNAYVSRGTNAS